MEVTRAERKASLGKQFQHQLSDLMGQLHRTEPHYVRCIKPNEHKSKLSFSPRMCYEQLTYSGVFEAVAIRKQGFPFRLTHEGFAERYGKVLREPASPGEIRKNARAICKKVVSEMKLDKTNVRFGKSRVLYRAMEYRVLELEWRYVVYSDGGVWESVGEKKGAHLLFFVFVFLYHSELPTPPLFPFQPLLHSPPLTPGIPTLTTASKQRTKRFARV